MSLKPLLSCSVLLALAQMAFAENITVSYSGTISYSEIPNVSVGDPFSGYFTYSVPSAILSDSPTLIEYSMNQPGDGLYFTVDGYWFSVAPNTNLALTAWYSYPTGAGTDNFLSALETIASPGAQFSTNYSNAYSFIQSGAQFLGNGLLQPSNALPYPFNPSDVILGYNGGYFTSAGVDVQEGSSVFGAFGLIDQIQVTETPEPGPLPLCGIGLALILVRLVKTRADRQTSRSSRFTSWSRPKIPVLPRTHSK